MVDVVHNRTLLIEVAADLLTTQGAEAVTTRAVAAAAGVQPPAIYRVFGDKDGLLDAVAEHAFTAYVARKPVNHDIDPLTDFRTGWNLHVDFGIANPSVYALMADPRRGSSSRAVAKGREILLERIRRIAAAGRLRVGERRAVELTHAIGSGTVLTLIATPPGQRDMQLVESAYQSLLSQILVDAPVPPAAGPATAAAALRTSVPDLHMLSEAERRLLTEWLDRITA